MPMRIFRVLPIIVIALHLSAVAKTAGMTSDDREHLLVHFQMTGQMLAGFHLLSWSTVPLPIAGRSGNAFPIWRWLNPTTGVN
jgi:hypothetical protein